MHVYMQTCRVKIRNIRGQRTPEERFIADISSREKANGEMQPGCWIFGGCVCYAPILRFIYFFFLPLKRIFREFKLWEIFSDTYKIFRRGYKKDSRKGVGWNWLERKFVLISCWMIVICFFFWEMKRVYKKYREFLFLFFFLNKERDEF